MVAQSVQHLIMNYREAAERTANADVDVANHWVDVLLACRKELRNSQEGREELTSLMSDPNPRVRGWAAAHCLAWAPEIARACLQALVNADGPLAFDAKWTLKEYDAGNLR